MHEELYVEILSPQADVPLDRNKVAEEWRYYEMTPAISSKWSAVCDLTRIYADSGFYDDAMAACKEAFENSLLKDYQSNLWFRMGQIMEHKRDFDTALQFYLNSIDVGSDNLYFQYWQHNNAAFCYLTRKEFDQAGQHCRIALEIDERNWLDGRWLCFRDTRNWNAWKNMGVVLEHTGRYEKAASFYITAIKLSRGNVRACLHFRRLLRRYPDLVDWWKEPIQDLLTYYNIII